MRLPTRRGVFLLALGLPLSFAALALNESVWRLSLLWLAFCIFALVVDAVFTAPLSALSVDISPPPLLYVGEPDTLALTLAVKAPRRGFGVALAADFNASVKPVSPREVQVSRTPVRVALDLLPVQRGEAVLHSVALRWRGPLGLMAAQHVLRDEVRMPVVPNTRAVAREAARLDFDDAILGLKQQRRKGQGTEFEALREFGQGADRRHIDWKHSARHGKLLVKEFDTERNHNVVFAFDSGQLMGEPLGQLSRLDHAINGSLMLARICMKAGDKLGLFSFDASPGQYLAPTGGGHAFGSFAAQTARIDQSPLETNFTLGLSALAQSLQRRSLILVMTDFTDSTTAQLMVENLGRLARRHLIVFVCFRDETQRLAQAAPLRGVVDVARVVVADELARERRVVLERLSRLGLLVLETEPAAFSFDVIQRYLDIKARALI